jgi:hypothetical protein
LLKFRCQKCGQRISVPEIHCDRKGRCPKCKTVIIIPIVDDEIRLQPRDSDNNNLQDAQQPDLLVLAFEPTVTNSEVPDKFLQQSKTEEGPPKRKLPWFLDIFLYPVSISGLINLGIYWILPILIALFIRGILGLIANIIISGYMYYFLMICVQDSADGGIRAPENVTKMPDPHEAVALFGKILASLAIFWGPMFVYIIYKKNFQSDAEYRITGLLFWLFLGYGIFFFPMGLLALAMFDSITAFNPILWITSILSTFFQYLGLVLIFFGLVFLDIKLLSCLRHSLLFSFFFGAVILYTAMIVAHLIGRFYYRNSEKLNWEV